MKITAVESSTLAAVGYDESRDLLQLEFRGGALYCYFAVPAAVHQSLLAAGSKGSYFNQAIRGRYQFVRVDGSVLAAAVVVDSNAAGNQRGRAWRGR